MTPLEQAKATIRSELQGLRKAGQAEYAHSEDNAFANFERVAKAIGISREKVLVTYALKHVDGVKAWLAGHKSQREDVSGRLNDIMVYMALLSGMHRGLLTRKDVADVLDFRLYVCEGDTAEEILAVERRTVGPELWFACGTQNTMLAFDLAYRLRVDVELEKIGKEATK